MAILLIGSTGNGKSTFGNFLIDPREEAIFDKQTFRVAKANMPETQFVHVGSLILKNSGGVKLSIIDTPGLNESNVHDLKHMIQIIEALHKFENVLACVLVVKFNSKIDAQYKATVQYYRKLLPSLFQRNVIVVMTDFANDDRSQKMRERSGTDVAAIKRNTINEIRQSGELSFDPILFTIDCLPLDEEEREINLKVREAILSRICSQTPVTSKGLSVAKTPFIKTRDNETIKGFEGEIEGYNKRLQEVNGRAKSALNKIQSKENEMSQVVRELQGVEREVREKDASDIVEVGGWSVSEDWKFFTTLSKSFDVSSPCRITSVDRWTNGKCSWANYEETEMRVTGKVQGRFMRGIYAHLKLQSTKRIKYANDIANLQSKARLIAKNKSLLRDQLQDIRDRHKEYIDDINRLMKFIEERRVKIQELAGDYMTLTEARERLQALEFN